MPYFELQKDDTRFPPAHFADGEGLLAVGGRMTPELLLRAYREGIFYWHHPMKHIRWWSPDPRIVADPEQLADAGAPKADFDEVAEPDPESLFRFFQQVYNRDGAMGPAWLSERMVRIFTELCKRGLGHTQGVYQNGRLVGGFFGVRLGEICHGEYAASLVPGADAAAISVAASRLFDSGIRLMDMQKPTARDGLLPYEERSRVAYVSQCRTNAQKWTENLIP